MCGCRRPEVSSISRVNRARKAGLLKPGFMTFTATFLGGCRSLARKTCAIPPSPISRSTV